MDELRIRKAGIDDLQHLLHHRRAMFEDMGESSAYLDRTERASSEYFREALTAGTYQAWVCETPEGEVIGGGGIVLSEWPGFPGEGRGQRATILNMYTKPKSRRRGIARRLMETMIAWCRAEGFASVSLHASRFGRPLYEALGFEPTNEMRLKLRRLEHPAERE
jgi:GNAT superfamily N-acetyltransferase